MYRKRFWWKRRKIKHENIYIVNLDFIIEFLFTENINPKFSFNRQRSQMSTSPKTPRRKYGESMGMMIKRVNYILSRRWGHDSKFNPLKKRRDERKAKETDEKDNNPITMGDNRAGWAAITGEGTTHNITGVQDARGETYGLSPRS